MFSIQQHERFRTAISYEKTHAYFCLVFSAAYTVQTNQICSINFQIDNKSPVSMAVMIKETHHNKDNHSACSSSFTQHYLQYSLWCAHHGVHDTMPWGYASVRLSCIWYKPRCFKVILECPSLLPVLLQIKFPCVTENCLTLCGYTNALQKPCACRWGSPLKAIQDSNLQSLYLPSPRIVAGLHTHTTPPPWLQSNMMVTLSDYLHIAHKGNA